MKNAERGEELPEDSILQNFLSKYHKMVADLMHFGSSWVLSCVSFDHEM